MSIGYRPRRVRPSGSGCLVEAYQRGALRRTSPGTVMCISSRAGLRVPPQRDSVKYAAPDAAARVELLTTTVRFPLLNDLDFYIRRSKKLGIDPMIFGQTS